MQMKDRASSIRKEWLLKQPLPLVSTMSPRHSQGRKFDARARVAPSGLRFYHPLHVTPQNGPAASGSKRQAITSKGCIDTEGERMPRVQDLRTRMLQKLGQERRSQRGYRPQAGGWLGSPAHVSHRRAFSLSSSCLTSCAACLCASASCAVASACP